ncbi:MAG TPA: YhcH/YjgK/YiaL family protein [Phycisphaerae bacterium]|nr:YhcH/YjgK/YiaL family protein [Phycisphaerae bacterium]HPS51919.1 YhcH/YjgK/YiaL family protein [Phycisphaerae bacterium]
MIFDSTDNLDLYFDAIPELEAVAEFLAAMPADAAGRTSIEGDDLYVNINEYETRLRGEGRYEFHQKYIDVQVVLEGREELDVLNETNLELTEAYDETVDVGFYARGSQAAGATLRMIPGRFAVLFPQDIHQPCIAANDEPSKVKKAVFKILF